jgi:hypothetical protein
LLLAVTAASTVVLRRLRWLRLPWRLQLLHEQPHAVLKLEASW